MDIDKYNQTIYSKLLDIIELALPSLQDEVPVDTKYVTDDIYQSILDMIDLIMLIVKYQLFELEATKREGRKNGEI